MRALPITGEYPADWNEIGDRVRAENGHRCIRCGHRRQYIRNRLIEAFRLGIMIGERIAAERIAAAARGEPDP